MNPSDRIPKTGTESETTSETGLKKEIRPRVKVQLVGTEPFFGPGVKTLLICIREQGSVRDACEKMGLSYSKGRKLLDRVERELGYIVVERSHGGKNGGSARLSRRGLWLLEQYEKLETEMKNAAEKAYGEIFGKDA